MKGEFIEKHQATVILKHNLSFSNGSYVKAKTIIKWKAQTCRDDALEFALTIQVIHGGRCWIDSGMQTAYMALIEVD